MRTSARREIIGMRNGTWRSQPRVACSRCCSSAYEACHSAVLRASLVRWERKIFDRMNRTYRMRDAAKAFVGSVSSHHPVHPVHPVQVFLALTDRLCEKARTKILLAVVLALANSDEAHAAEQSLWLENGRAVAQASEMLSAMRDAEIYGLRPADYAVEISAAELQAVRSGHADAGTRQRFESGISRAAARFVTHVHSGRIDPASAG